MPRSHDEGPRWTLVGDLGIAWWRASRWRAVLSDLGGCFAADAPSQLSSAPEAAGAVGRDGTRLCEMKRHTESLLEGAR